MSKPATAAAAAGNAAAIAAASGATTNPPPGASKLPAIPQSVTGELPYFVQMFRKRSETAKEAARKNEAALVPEQLAWACHSVFKINKYRSHHFRWSERLSAAREQVRISAISSPAAWDTIQETVREFEAVAAVHAEQCLAAVHRLFKGRVPLPKHTIPIEDDPRSFVVRDAGVFVHAWTSDAEAKAFVDGQKHLAAAVRDLRTEAFAVPLTALFSVAATYVSVTALAPLVTLEPVDVSTGPIICHAIDEIEVLCRTQKPLRCWQGADGRLHLLDPTPAVHRHGLPTAAGVGGAAVSGNGSGEAAEPASSSSATGAASGASIAAGDWNLALHPGLFDRHPNLAVNVPRALDEAMEANVAAVVSELHDLVLQRAGGNAANVRGAVKVLDLIEENVVASIFHRHGVKLRLLFKAMSHPALRTGSEAGAVVRELLLNEMVGRTMKAIVRSDVAHTPSQPPLRGTTAVAHAFVTDIVNRCIFAMLVRKEFWDPQFLPILRAKYGAPEEFSFKQEIVAKRTVVSFLRIHLGAVFEGGKFAKLAPVLRAHTAPTPSHLVSRLLDGHKQEVHDALLARMKVVQEGQLEPSLKLCMMLVDMVTAAASKAPFLMKSSSQLSQMLDQMNDDSVSVVMRGVAMECMLEISEISAFLNALSRYRDNCLLPIGTDYPVDHFFIAQRYRLCGTLLLSADKMRRVDAGALFTNAARYFMVTFPMVDALLPDPVFALYIEVIRYNLIYDGATPYDAYDLANRLFQSLLVAIPCDRDRRRERLCDAMRHVLAKLMSLPQDFPLAGRIVFGRMAEEIYRLHKESIPAENDPRRQIMLLVVCTHVLSMNHPKITANADKESVRGFKDVAEKVEEALASETKGILRADWAMPKYGPAAALLQRFTAWGLSKELLDMIHGFTATGQFKSTAARAAMNKASATGSGVGSEARRADFSEFCATLDLKYNTSPAKAVPDLMPPTEKLIVVLKAAFKLQAWHRDLARRRAELLKRREEERERLAAVAKARAERIAARLPPREIVAAATALADADAKRIASAQVPPMLPIHAPRLASSGFGLQTLIAIAKPRSCINLCAVMLQSEVIPPVKWAIVPSGPGSRAIAVLPGTAATAAWFNERWLSEADWYVGDEHPSVTAKKLRISENAASFALRKKSMRDPATAAAAAPTAADGEAGGDDLDNDTEDGGGGGGAPGKEVKNVSFNFATTVVSGDFNPTSDILRTKTLLFAKVYAIHLYAQNKYSFLKWVLTGVGWAAPVTELLATMVPADCVHSLVTFGGLPAFGDFSDDIPRVAHAHVFHRRDMTAYLPLHPWLSDKPDVWDFLQSRLRGAGQITLSTGPLAAPSFEFLQMLSHYAHLGNHLHVLWTSEDQAAAQAAEAEAKQAAANRKLKLERQRLRQQQQQQREEEAAAAATAAANRGGEPAAAPDKKPETEAKDGEGANESGDAAKPDAPAGDTAAPAAAAGDDDDDDDDVDADPAAMMAPTADGEDGEELMTPPESPQALELPTIPDSADGGASGEAAAGAAAPENANNSSSKQCLYFLVNVNTAAVRFLDVRIVLPEVAASVYHGCMLNVVATSRALEFVRETPPEELRAQKINWTERFNFGPAPPLPPLANALKLTKYLDPYGRPKPALQTRMNKIDLVLPMTIEPIAATMELLLLAYPRLGLALLSKATYIPESYGGFPNFDFAERMERHGSASEADLAAILDQVKSATWDCNYVAKQLFELSACGLPADEDTATTAANARAADKAAATSPSKSSQSQPAAATGAGAGASSPAKGSQPPPQRRNLVSNRLNAAAAAAAASAAPTAINTLYVPLLESFVETHNLALTVPLKSAPPVVEPEPVEEEAKPPEVDPNAIDDDVEDEAAMAARKAREDAEAAMKAQADGKDTIAAALGRPDGYHLGWCVAVASATRGVGKSTLMHALVGAELRTPAVTKVPLTPAQLQSAAYGQPGDVPFIRLLWRRSAAAAAAGMSSFSSPSAARNPNGNNGHDAHPPEGDRPSSAAEESNNHDNPADDDDDDDDDGATTIQGDATSVFDNVGAQAGDGAEVVQLHFQKVRYDGKRAATLSMQCAAQCVWVVSDKYSVDALVRSGGLDRHAAILNAVVYHPRGTRPDPETMDAVKRLALARSIPFAVVDDPRSIAALLQNLVQWMLPSIRFPLNPSTLPANVELGSLSSLDPRVITAYIDGVTAKAAIAKQRAGAAGAGATLGGTTIVAGKTQLLRSTMLARRTSPPPTDAAVASGANQKR